MKVDLDSSVNMSFNHILVQLLARVSCESIEVCRIDVNIRIKRATVIVYFYKFTQLDLEKTFFVEISVTSTNYFSIRIVPRINWIHGSADRQSSA